MASVTLVADAGKTASREDVLDKGDGGGQGTATTIPGRLLAAGTTALAASAKRVLVRHNIGRNTVEIVFPSAGGSDSPRGAVGSLEEAAKGDSGGSGGGRGAVSSAAGQRSRSSVHDEAERGELGAGGGAGSGRSHGGHSHVHGHGHGQCSGHGHSHGHASSVDLVGV